MDYLDAISEPISADNICGENLEEDAEFQNFFFLAQGTPERFDGENTLAAEPPDWRAIKKQALEYLTRTKDVKLICILAQATLNTEGLPAFSDCLRGLASLFENEWQTLYPPLDEDDGDPLVRTAALSHLSEAFVTQSLKSLPIASAKGIGQVSINTLQDAEQDKSLSDSQIKGIFEQNNSDALQLLHTSVAYSLESLACINRCLADSAGHEYTVDFAPLTDLLTQMTKILETYSEIGADPEELGETPDDSSAQEAEDMSRELQGSDRTTQNATPGTPGKVTCRDDVEQCLKAVKTYYETYEPSSPLPVLINRALKLVDKDFLTIMKDIYPDALPALYQLGGLQDEEDDVESDESSDSDDSW